MLTEKKFICKRDNLEIHGRIIMPKSGEKYGSLPIAVISHEFKTDMLFSLPYANAFAEIGFAAFIFDFCGGCIIGSSSGEMKDMTIQTEIQDLKAVINYACSLDFTDSDNIILMGSSQGGLVTSMLAAEAECSEIKGIILQYPGFIIPFELREGRLLQANFDPYNIPDTVDCGLFKLGKNYIESAVNLNPYDIIGKYRGNVLIIHGSEDKVVDPDYSRKAYEIYKESGANVSLEIIDGATHIFKHPQHIDEAEFLIKRFALKVI